VNLRQLEYVVAIAETGSFTAAAARCHTAQSALSHQVASLERSLGTKLFDRSSRSVRLTEAGRLLLPVAQRVLGELRDVRNELRQIDGIVRGPLRIGATQTGMRLYGLTRVLADYNRQHPDVNFSLTLGPGFELFADLRSAGLDIVFAAVDGSVPDDMEYFPLGRVEPLAAVMSPEHPLASRSAVKLRQLAEVSRFIDFRAQTMLWKKIRVMSDQADVERQVMCEVGTIQEMISLAATGVGVAVVPRVFTEETESEPGPPAGIRAIPLDEPDSYLSVGAFCEKSRMKNPAIRTFIEVLDKKNAR
jgi:DNA-binding transcriptional LysR family regulator